MGLESNNKYQATNDKQYQNNNDQNTKRYDLEERTLKYARGVSIYVSRMPRTIVNIENGKQLVRAAGSVGANYIEANEALSKKDFIMRVKISRKEAKESRYWLNLTEPDQANNQTKEMLINEATQLIKILSSILVKCGVVKY
ncbi:MAG: four helix bundle protein [Candidatus Margulisbacteria bacterium]|nr:four helix bundle protein [Candidatus Margulisiibacteriota bacterium]